MIPLTECVARRIYKLHSRNLKVGVFNGEAFIGIRTKFGNKFLDKEYHCDYECGTAKPLEEIGELPVEILLLDDPVYCSFKKIFDFLEKIEKENTV